MLPDVVLALVAAMLGVSALCVIAAVVIRRRTRISEAEHFERWTAQMWPDGGSYAQQVDEASWLTPRDGERP